MDVNSRDPSQNILPFRIKGVEAARFDICGNLGIGTTVPTANLEVVGTVKISGTTNISGAATIGGNTTIAGNINVINNASTNYNSINSGITINGRPIENKTTAVVNIDSQPAAATALNRQKKQSIPLAGTSTLATSDVVAKMSGVSVGKTQTYGVSAAQMASYGNIVVAVGEGTNSIAYSLVNPPTASSWVGISTNTLFNGVANTFTTRGRNITYANGTWVAVGEGINSIAYSTMTPPVASSWVGIRTDSSFNGVINTFNGTGRDIAYGNGAWVAVGDGVNAIAYSLANPPTAESWVGIPSTTSNFSSAGWSITFGNGTWVATGQGTNGIAYSTRTPPTADSWVVVPLTTTNDASIANVSSSIGINIIYANGVWLASGSGTNTLCYSIENPPIAGSWMPITSAVLFGTNGRSVAYGNGTWVACGESTSLLAYSTSRIPHSSSWVAMKGPTPSSNGEIINHVGFNAATNTWYFLGDIGNNCLFYSTATPPVPATWIGVQKSAGVFSLQAYGAVGITTNAFTSPINVARLDNKVTFPANRMIAVGGGGSGIDVVARSSASPAPAMTGTISYSDDDGATWTMVPGGATNAMFSSAADIASGTSFGVGGSRGANAVAWNGEKWVAGGNGRTNSLAFSDDGGMTWTGITGKSVFSVEARDIAWNGQMWVAVGRGIVFSTAYSYDGVTWMGPVTNDISSVPINVFSYDIAGPAAGSSDISGGGKHVIWTGKMWVATGTRTLIAGSSPAAYYTVAYSVDGKTWTGMADSGATSTGFDMYAHGIAWNGRNLVATGRGTVNTLAFSTDGSSWQGLGNTVFSVWGRGITWGARRWMATGRGTNTVAFSTNGRNWQGCGANVFKPLRRFMAMGDTGLYTGQRGVAFSYSDDGITWDAPVVNQAVEFSTPLGASNDTTRSVIWTGQMLLTNVITDNGNAHQSLVYSTDAGASWSRVPGTSDTEANGGTGMTTANYGCLSVTTNTTRTRFIAGGGDSGSATKKVYFSNDGFNWRNGVSSPNSNTQFAWVYASLWVGGGYNRWLIGGNNVVTQANGLIMYSGDADAVAAWTPASGTFTGTIISCFAANTDFSLILAGGASGNTIYRAVSNGGTSWATTSISSTPIGGVRSIAFSPSLGRWVAVGGGGGAANTIIYSTDASGTAWIAPPLQAKAAATAIFKNGSEVTRVIWDALNGGRFIIGGFNGVYDYATFTNVAGLDGTNNNPGYTMAYSADGVNWTPVTVRASDAGSTSSSGTTFGPFLTRCREIMALDVSGEYTPINTGYSVTWNSYANRFVATGNGTTPVVYSSDGGVTWTPANQQPPQQAIAVAGGASAASGTGTASPITYTIDGKIWSQGIGAKEVFGASVNVRCVKYGQTSTAISPNGRIWVAGAESGDTSCLAFSQNGIRWTAIANAKTMITNVRTIMYAPAEQMLSTSASTGAISNASLTAASGVGNGVWVAGGDTTNSLIFSYDGISWSEVPGSLAILNRCNACAFGNGVFVAGGSSGTTDTTAVLAYSTDGINWQPIRGTKSRISTSAVIQSITYGRDERGRGLWVAGATYVNNNPTITLLYSYNGIDWIGVNDSSSLSASINGIAYGVSATTGQGLWVASVYNSSSYSFLFSTTGRDGWTTVTNTKTGLFEPSGTGATGIAYLNGVWYATGLSAGVSTGRTLAYSYDGSGGWFGVYPSSNMYGAVIPTFSQTGMYCIATTVDYTIPGGATGPSAMVPVRSIGWTAGIGSAYLQHPTLLFGTDASRSVTAISTDGGRSWGSSLVSLGSSAFRGGVCNDAFWNGSVWVAVGYDAVSGAKVATSRDGVAWSQIPAGTVPITGILYSVMWNGTVWMVGGDGSPTNDANTASIAWSTDLAVWNAVANTDTKLYLVKRISWNGMYWVAVGLGTVSTMTHSKDRNGLVWEDTYLSSSSVNKTASITSAVNDVVWGGGRWVAVGRGNDIVGGGGVSILYSADTPVVGGEPAEYAITGRRWTGVASSASLFPYGANSVSWNGKRFVATGPAYFSKSGTAGNIIAWSADGISWTAYSTTKTVAPGQRWVAVGSGSAATIATSGDGRTWTDVSGSPLLFSDISGASTAIVNTMLTGARAIGWNGSSLIVGGSRSATTMTETSRLTATATTGRTTIPVCAFIGSGNGVIGGGTTNGPMDISGQLYIRNSSSVFITHLDVNIREASAPYANMWLNTYTDLSATQIFQVTPESQTFSSALKWNGWSWVANFGMTTTNPITGSQYGSIWYCTDPLARIGWSVASNSEAPRILIGQGGYAGLEWNGAAWLACGYDPNNNNLIYTTDKYGATGWTAVSGIVSGGSASFQPVCIASSSRFWVVGGSQGTTSALYYTNDRTGATGWKSISTVGGASVLPGIRITSVGYNGASWICCGGGGGGSGSPASSISWRADTGDDIGTGWAAATVTGSSAGIPSNMSNSSAIAYNAGASPPIWVVVGDVSGNDVNQVTNQVSYTTSPTGSADWKTPSVGSSFTLPTFSKLNGIAWTGYSWIASCGAGTSRIVSSTDVTATQSWNPSATSLYSPTLCTNAVAYANIPISLLTTGMPTTAGVGAGSGAMWRGGVGRTQGLLPGGGIETTSVVVRSNNGAEGATWSQTYSRNFLIAVGGSVIRDAGGIGGTNRMAYSYDGGLSWTTNNSAVLTTAGRSSVGSIRTVKYGNGMWVAGGDSAGSSSGSGNNCLAWSRDGVNWTGAGGTQIFGSAGACYAVCCNDRGRWVAVGGAALTTAGTYTNASGAIYTMAWSDDGMNWTPILGSRALFGIVCQGVSYGADASGVGMWTAIGRGGTYTGCAYSYDGKTWFLSQTSASLFGTSANVLTERYAPAAGADWRTVAINSTGQIQFAAANAGLVWRSMDYGVTWSSLTLPSRAWVSVAVSSTGQYVVIANADATTNDRLYTSSDFGITWISKGFNYAWKQVAISASGQYQVGAADSQTVRISRDFGVTWVVSGDAGQSNWTSIAISSSGQYITVVSSSAAPRVSINYGYSYDAYGTGLGEWYSVVMSSTGQIQIGSNTTNIRCYGEAKFGKEWNQYTNSNFTTRYRSLAMSSTGRYIVGVNESSSESIKRSIDTGGNWSAVGPVANYSAIAMSSTGQYQTAVSQTASGLIYISSNFGETWQSASTDSRSLGVAYGKDASGVGMWVATAGRRDRDISANAANTMAYSYDGKLWRGITASAGLSEQAWTVAYGKDGFGVGMWVAGGYDRSCGLKWSYDGVTWNATMGASGSAVWAGMAAGRRVLSVYWNGSMWLASTSDTRNGEPGGTGIAANNASGVPGYLLYSYNGKNWLPVLAPNTYSAVISSSAQPSVYSVLPNPAILDFGSFYDDQTQRGVTITNTTARTVGAVMSNVPIKNVNTIVPYGRGSLTTGQVPFLMGGDSGLMDTVLPITSELAASTTSISTSVDGGVTWRAVPNSTRVMTKVNKILCDESTQQIVAVGAGNYSVATSTPARASDADGWVGVFGSRMTNTRTGLFEKYGTAATWFGGAKMWIASGRTQSRRGSSLAVSVNGTVWQDAKIVSQTAAGTSLGGRGGGLTCRTTGGAVTTTTFTPITTTTGNPDVLYTFTAFTFDNAGATGREGPELATVRTSYTNRGATWATTYLNMTTRGIQEWTVPATGSYTIRAKGASGGGRVIYNSGIDLSLNVELTKGEVIRILVGQMGVIGAYTTLGGGGGGTFVVRGSQASPTAILVAGGGGGSGYGGISNTANARSDAASPNTGNGNNGCGTTTAGDNRYGTGGTGGNGGGNSEYADSGAGLTGNGTGSNSNQSPSTDWPKSFTNGGTGGSPISNNTFGGFGGGGSANSAAGGGGGGGYSGGGGGGFDGNPMSWVSGGGGGSFPSTSTLNGWNAGHGSVTITPNFTITSTTTTTSSIITTTTTPISFTSSVIPYTAPATPLLTYTDSAAAFSTQVSSVATNSQYNRAVVGGSGVQFVAGGRGIGSNGSGLVYSNDGQNWTAVESGAATVFQTPTNVAAYSTSPGSGGFDAAFGTVALTQRLTVPATYVSSVNWRSVSVSATGQYQSAVVNATYIYTSSDYGITWTARNTAAGTFNWTGISVNSTGQYQLASWAGSGSVGELWSSSDYGVTWTKRRTIGNWYVGDRSISSTGQYQSATLNTASNIYTSSDYGVTWTQQSASDAVARIGISVSSTGQYQSAIATSSNIYISSNYGVSWTTRDSGRSWTGISISSTGQYQLACAGTYVYTSSDYGINWTPRTQYAGTWKSVSMSSTGQYQSAVVNSTSTSGFIYTSSDFGVTWTPRLTDANRAWNCISVSSTGQYQTAVVNPGSIYTSTDYGVTWVQRSTASKTNAFTRIKSSASGQYQIATSGPVGNTNGQLYVSSDYGQTWIPRRGLATWLGGAVSATGAVMMTMVLGPPTIIKLNNALSYSPILYLDATNSSSYNGSTWTNLGSLGGNVVMTNMGSFDSTDNGGSFNFDGSINYGTLSIASTTLTQLTFIAVVKPTTISSNSKNIISFGYINPVFFLETSTSAVSFYSRDPNYTINTATNGTISTLNVWYHLAVTVTTTGALTFYINGVSSGTATGTAATWIQTSFGIGAATNGENKFSGKISSLAAYNRVLTASEIYNLYITSTILRSIDYGNTFTDVPSTDLISPAYWRSASTTNSASTQTALAYGGSIYRSSDTGATWSNTGITIDGGSNTARNWQDIAVAAETGAVQVTCVSGGYIYYSGDTGATWTSSIVSIDGVSPQTTNRAWQAVALSANGQYGLACVNSTTASGFLYRSLNYGASWTSSSVVIDGAGTQTTSRPWQDVGMSANGKYQVACLNNSTQTAFTSNIASTVSVMVPPPGALATTLGSSWSQLGLDISGNQVYENSGYSVSLSADGTIVAIGSYVYDITGTYAEGRTRIYKYNNGTSLWGQLGLDISGNQAYEQSGYSVSLSADGTTVAIGSFGYNVIDVDDAGRTRIYKYNGTTWGQLGLDISGNQRAENSGYSVSLSADGTTVAIGSYAYDVTGTNNEGRTRIYKYNGASWGQLGLDISGNQAYEQSGQSVSLSADGTTVAIGSPYYDVTGGNEGRTRIYKYNNGTSSWGQLGLDISGNQLYEYSGWSVSISADGTTVAIGSYAYDVTGGNNEGRTRIYKYNGTSWGQLGLDISGNQANELSGISVSLSADGTTVAIGSSGYNVTGVDDVGRTRIYKYNGASWGQLGLDISGIQVYENSGYSVSLSADGTVVAIGSYAYDVTSGDEGRTRIYKIPVTNPITYTSSNSSVADICGNLLLIKGVNNNSTSIAATQGATTTIGALTVSGSTYTLVYTITGTSTTSFIYYSKDYGASWTSLTAAGSRSWSSIALSANGGTISATTNDAAGAIWTYTMPDDQYYRPPAITNVTGIGGTTTSTIRAITYGNSGTGAATDGYWVAGADASANTLAYSSNGVDWTAVVGSKTTLFNSVNGVAYGADLSGTMMWVAVGTPFIGSVPGSTAYSIAYSYNMTNWTGVRNIANFTGQGNHVAYGQDEYGTGMWVAVGQGSGVLAANLGSSSFGNSNGVVNTTVFYSYDGANWSAATGTGVFSTSGTDVAWGVDASGVATWVASGIGFTDPLTGVFIPGGQVAHSTNGRVWTPIRNGVTTITPFTTSALSVAYGRGGSQGTGAPLWMVGGSGGNVFAASSRPSSVDANAWYTIAEIIAPSPAAPFPVCNSIGYSNGIWVAGNNTDYTNVLAQSIDGGFSWTPVTLSSVNGFMAGCSAIGANAFCNYSLAYADYSNDTNLRSWIAIPGTKNFMFEGGVSAVATVTTNIVASTYNTAGAGTRAWWVAGGSGTSSTGVAGASLAYSTDPSGASGWTKSISTDIANLATINDITFSPQTQRWLAVGVGATSSANSNILFSDASGITWTSTAVATPTTPVITLNTCIWNQLDASASAAGRWIAGGTRNDISVSIPTSATLYISTDTSGAASPWTPIEGTGAILSQVYSLAFNGRVWIAAGVPASDSGSTSTLMSTSDPTGTTGWQGISTTNASTTGFDTAARSVAWNADHQMWVATGENTATAGSGTAVDASFSSVIYSLDVSGGTGTWRTVRESNSSCFSGQGNGIAFTGRKWLAVGEGTNQIVATADISANTAFGTGTAPTWSSGILSIGNANTILPVRGTDIAFTGRNLIATGVGSGSSSGVVSSTDSAGTSWSTVAAAGFTDASGGGTSITFEPTYEGVGRLVATGKSATNSITVSSDGGATWNTSATATATAVQFSSRQQTAATTQTLFTTGGNSVAYVGNDTLFAVGGNDVHWTGKRWIATGKNTGTATATATLGDLDITNNNTAPIAVSDDGITWQCVSSGQAPNLTEGIFVATNSRISSTPLIDSQITIMDGGDTEPILDYGSGSGIGGIGTGIAQIDIVAELPVTSVSASNTTGAVTTIGVGSNTTNGVGVTPVASFDNTAFTITTRPV